MKKDRNEGKSFGQIEKEKLGGSGPTAVIVDELKPKRRLFLGRKPGHGVKLNPFEKKEFRAYVRGHSTFYHGKVLDETGRPRRNKDGSLVLHQHKTRVAYVEQN